MTGIFCVITNCLSSLLVRSWFGTCLVEPWGALWGNLHSYRIRDSVLCRFITPLWLIIAGLCLIMRYSGTSNIVTGVNEEACGCKEIMLVIHKWPTKTHKSYWFTMGLLPDTYNCGLRMRRECRERFPRHRLLRKPLVSDPGMHHGTCVTHVPWCMSGPLTHGGGENVPGIPGAWANRNFTYLARGP